jgi:hypothetical protein
MNHMEYDYILCVNNQINEDRRSTGSSKGGTYSRSPQWMNNSYDWDDPKLYASFSFGNAIQSQLNSIGAGFSAQVSDFGKWVVVTVTHSDIITGRSASKTFLVVFKPDGDGIILNSHNRYRTISGYSEAINYIRSVSSNLRSATQTKMG